MPTHSTVIQRKIDAITQIPASCTCPWSWTAGRWIRTRPDDECPWHLSRGQDLSLTDLTFTINPVLRQRRNAKRAKKGQPA